MLTWARDEVAIPAVRRWVEAGNDVDVSRSSVIEPTDDGEPTGVLVEIGEGPAIT